MRILLIAALVAPVSLAAMPAAAQRAPRSIPQPGQQIPPSRPFRPHFEYTADKPNPQYRPNPTYRPRFEHRDRQDRQFRHNRWGQTINGRWQGGWNAPGGWGGYRRPSRGWTLPHYWMGSGFQIPDYYSYGLVAPPAGYFWVRYYDDAVMVDSYGRVRDSVSGLGWADADADVDYDYGYGGAAASASASAGGGAITGVDPNPGYYTGYGTSYDYQDQGYPRGGYAPPAVVGPPAVQFQGGCAQGCQGYGYQGGGYGYQGGYYYGAPVTTTVVIQSAPVVTTTVTEEIIEEETVYVAPAKRVKRVYRAPTKLRPRCEC